MPTGRVSDAPCLLGGGAAGGGARQGRREALRAPLEVEDLVGPFGGLTAGEARLQGLS